MLHEKIKHVNFCRYLYWLKLANMLYYLSKPKGPLGQAVKTQPSQGWIMGSIPVGVTNKKRWKVFSFPSFFCCYLGAFIWRNFVTFFLLMLRLLLFLWVEFGEAKKFAGWEASILILAIISLLLVCGDNLRLSFIANTLLLIFSRLWISLVYHVFYKK